MDPLARELQGVPGLLHTAPSATAKVLEAAWSHGQRSGEHDAWSVQQHSPHVLD